MTCGRLVCRSLRVVLLAVGMAGVGCGGAPDETLPPDDFQPLPDALGVAEAEMLETVSSSLTMEPQGFSMVFVPAGQFTMGSPDSESRRGLDEIPHVVRLTRDFYVATHETTQELWESVMETNPSAHVGADHPVEGINWFQAAEFSNRLSIAAGFDPVYTIRGKGVSWDRGANGYRLPTEAEWEYAARAGTVTPYHMGLAYIASLDEELTRELPESDIRSLTPTVVRTHAVTPTRPVGSVGPNPWGLYDVHGNVGEWCWDWYGPYPSEEEVTDPIGPPWAGYRVVRGWGDRPGVRSARRTQNTPNLGLRVGLRLVRFSGESIAGLKQITAEPPPKQREAALDRCIRLFEVVMACDPEGPAMFVEERAAVMDFDGDGFPDRASLFGDRLHRHGHEALVDSLTTFFRARPEMFMMDIRMRCEKFASRGLEPAGTAVRPTGEAAFVAIEAVEDCFELPCAERIDCIRPFVSATLVH